MAMQSASEIGGVIAGVLADSLLRASTQRANREGLLAGQLVLISPYHPEAGFNAGNAMARNRVIYALAGHALVVQAEQGKGGTWAGATENLREHWVPLLVRQSTEVPGNAELMRRGGIPFAFDPNIHGSLRDYLRAVIQHAERPTATATEHAKPDLFTEGEAAPDAEPVSSGVDEAAEPFLNEPAEREAGSGLDQQDAQDMFPEFSRRIRSLLAAGPKTEKEIQETMGLEPVQAKAWLKKAEQEHVVVKTKRPVRFALAREGRLF
jgi:predicted Rossmann fold nucleotide-binding protein DprA/Smf involved in DNA uptake